MEHGLFSIQTNGGNSVRIHMHWDGIKLPGFESQIFANGIYTESVIADLKDFLDDAEKNNLFVIISLWNGFAFSEKLSKLITDIKVLQLYIDKLITPMATALSKHKALAIWEIMDGPDGMVAINKNNDVRCFDTTEMKVYNVGWKNSILEMEQVLRFINKMSSALHTASPSKLVAVGIAKIDEMLSFNHFSNDCLIKAGGYENGFLDLYVFVRIIFDGEHKEFIPLQKSLAELKFDKPIIIARVSEESTSMSLDNVYLYLLNFNYSGCLALAYGTINQQDSVNKGLRIIRDHILSIFINENKLSQQ
jgi:mannan endo-1,4-beta-mannosidase